MLMAFQLLSHITPHARRPDRGSTSCARRGDPGDGGAGGTCADQDDTNKPSES